LRALFWVLIPDLQSSLHQMVLFFGIWFAFEDAIICYFDENIRKFLNTVLQIVSVQSSKAALYGNAAQSALCSFEVGLEKDGEGISVVITIG